MTYATTYTKGNLAHGLLHLTECQSPGQQRESRQKDRMGKHVSYFKDNNVLPIQELVAETEPKIPSFIVTDLRTRRLAGLKKEVFAAWDVLLPSDEVAVKLAESIVSTKYFRLKPEYQGRRRIRVTMCNITVQLNGDVPLTTFVGTAA